MYETNAIPPADRDRTSDLGNRARILAAFINGVGLPVFIVVTLMVFIGLASTGYVSAPWISAKQFEEHQKDMLSIQSVQVESTKEQTKVLTNMQSILKGIACNQYPTDQLKLQCFLRIDEGLEAKR